MLLSNRGWLHGDPREERVLVGMSAVRGEHGMLIRLTSASDEQGLIVEPPVREGGMPMGSPFKKGWTNLGIP